MDKFTDFVMYMISVSFLITLTVLFYFGIPFAIVHGFYLLFGN